MRNQCAQKNMAFFDPKDTPKTNGGSTLPTSVLALWAGEDAHRSSWCFIGKLYINVTIYTIKKYIERYISLGIGNSIHRETILEFSFAKILDINTFNGHYIEKSSVDHLQKACRHGSEKLASGRSRESHWIVLPRKKTNENLQCDWCDWCDCHTKSHCLEHSEGFSPKRHEVNLRDLFAWPWWHVNTGSSRDPVDLSHLPKVPGESPWKW